MESWKVWKKVGEKKGFEKGWFEEGFKEGWKIERFRGMLNTRKVWRKVGK